MAVPEQTDCVDGVATAVGSGFKTIADVTGAELHPPTVAIAVYVVAIVGFAYTFKAGVPAT